MKAKLNNTFVASLAPQQKPYEVFDTDLTGLLVRVEPSGRKTFYARYRPKGSKRRRSFLLGSFPTLSTTQARDLAKARLGEVAAGKDPAADLKALRKKAKVLTLKQFLETEYQNHIKGNHSNYLITMNKIKDRFKSFLSTSLDELTPLDIERWKAGRLDAKSKKSDRKVSPVTVNRELADLRAALNLAVDWGFIDRSPLERVKQAKCAPEPIVRYLSPTEETKLREMLDRRQEEQRRKTESHNRWLTERGFLARPVVVPEGFTDHVKPMVLLSMNTGLRRGELLKLGWSDIDIVNNILTVRAAAAKSKKSRHVALNTEAVAVLTQWKAQFPTSNGLVFPGKSGVPMTNIKSSWESLLKKAGITRFRWHDMRHHFASKLVMNEVDLNTVRELLGHADLKMTLRYAHLANSHKAAAVEMLVKAN